MSLAAAPACRAACRLLPTQPTRPARPGRSLRLPAVALAAPARRASLVSTLASSLLAAEGYLERWVADVQRSAETRLQACLLGLLFTAQRLLRWVQLAAMALTLQRSTEAAQQQQQMQLAYAGAAAGSSAGPAAAPSSGDGSPSPVSSSAVPEASSMIGFIGGAATGAVEQLRHTLNDAGAGMGEKMAALERTASSLQSSLFRAAQEHSANVRSNPSGGMWKQPSVDAVISEEERLRAAVFAQVFAELQQKDNKELGYSAQP